MKSPWYEHEDATSGSNLRPLHCDIILIAPIVGMWSTRTIIRMVISGLSIRLRVTVIVGVA